MITIHVQVDPSDQTPGGALALTSENQYPTIRRNIRDALQSERSEEVYIQTRVCDGWFWDLSDYSKDVVLLSDSPTDRLKRKLGVGSLPSDLANEPAKVLALDLLNLPNSSDTRDVWAWIIDQKLGGPWTAEEPSPDHFSGLVNWFLFHEVDPLLQAKTAGIAESWTKSATGRLKNAYAVFFRDPLNNARRLALSRALAGYDYSLRQNWLEAEGLYAPDLETFSVLVELPAGLPALLRHRLNGRILTHWNSRLKEIRNV